MSNYYIRYFISRELYRQFNKNRDNFSSYKFLKRIFFTLLFILLIFVFLIGFFENFNRTDKKYYLNRSSLKIGDSLFVNPDRYTKYNTEVPIYKIWLKSNSEYIKADSSLRYSMTFKNDSSKITFVGKYSGKIFNFKDYKHENDYIQIIRDKSFKISKP